MSTRHETNHKVYWCHFITQYMHPNCFKCLQKKRRLCPFFFCKGRAEEPEKRFCSDWAETLAKSNKGSYFDKEQWLKGLNEQPSVECAIFI